MQQKRNEHQEQFLYQSINIRLFEVH